MNKLTKEDIELETLKIFLKNNNIDFKDVLIGSTKKEPTDIRYDGANYQITIGDKEIVAEMRRKTSKGQSLTAIRNVSNIVALLLGGALTKKTLRADSDTILLLDVASTGNNTWEDLKTKASKWAKNNIDKCKVWKEIYLIYSDKNIKVEY